MIKAASLESACFLQLRKVFLVFLEFREQPPTQTRCSKLQTHVLGVIAAFLRSVVRAFFESGVVLSLMSAAWHEKWGLAPGFALPKKPEKVLFRDMLFQDPGHRLRLHGRSAVSCSA